MVTKKLLKTKVSVSNQNKIKNSMYNLTNKKPIFVSQKVIISSIFDKCLIEPNTNYILPDHISYIFREMISDAAHINETLTKKDYSFYDCGIGFYDAEKLISSKRKDIVEFMLKKADELPDNEKKSSIPHKKSRNCSKPRQKESSVQMDDGIVSTDNKSETNLLTRTQRKRKRPSKLHSFTETPERQQRPNKEPNQLIDLAMDSSSDGEPLKPSTIPASVSTGSQSITKPACKVYFREPTASTATTSSVPRKSALTTAVSTSSAQRRVKQHTLLDKVLLGVNCVRQATERGLHLSRLCEADLGLLNKRLASINSVRLAELEEHTDDNNNRTLSVLLQAPGLVPVVATGHSTSPATNPEPNEPQDSPEPTQTYIRPQKSSSKPHVPVMYRQRHAVPGILAKPSGLLCDEHTRPSSAITPIKFEPNNTSADQSNGEATPVAVAAPALAEPQMTASQLLKIRLQKSSLDAAAQEANQKRLQSVEEPSGLPAQPVVPKYAVAGTNGVRAAPMPFILVPPSKLIPLVSTINNNCNRRPQVSPVISASSMLTQHRAITKIQRIPLQINGLCKSPLITSQHLNKSLLPGTGSATAFDSTPNFQRAPTQSQSVILKNLLQQPGSQHQYYQPSSSALSTNGMMPLSVFQNSSKPKRQQFTPYSLHRPFPK